MEPLARAKRLSGDQKDAPGSKVITSEVPDKPKRSSVKGKTKILTTAHELDLSEPDNELTINNPVDTDLEGLDVQAANVPGQKEIENLKVQGDSITFDSLTSGTHEDQGDIGLD
jgi:hypothetical protein